MDKWKESTMKFIGDRGLCDTYKTPLISTDNIKQAIRIYKNCPEWALENDYPTLPFFREVFSKEELAENGVFIDTEFDGEIINSHVCCIFHNCTGVINTRLNLDKCIIPMMYFSNNCNMQVNVLDGSVVPCWSFMGSKVDGNISLRKSMTTDYSQDIPPNLTQDDL